MYQAFVLGLGALLVVGIGYFINETDQGGVISSHIVEASSTSDTLKASLPGTYICDTEDKCIHPRVLTITSDETVTLVTSYENGAETIEESGTWTVNPEKKLTIIITGSKNGLYDTPYILGTQYVGAWTIVGGTQGEYKEWSGAIFRKQDKNDQGEGVSEVGSD